MKDIYSVLIRPIITEKATNQKEQGNQVVFLVAKDANKIEIKNAVEKIFNKKVLAVQTMNRKGKYKRQGRYIGKRPDYKRAIVRLYPGETIEFIEGV